MKKIMIVDDEKDLRELIKGIFGQEYKVLGAASGQECLEMLRKEKPDLILMDMMMSAMSGRGTTERIRKNPKTKSLKIAFLTVARFSVAGKATLKRLNILDYITKPFDNEDLFNKVKKLIG